MKRMLLIPLVVLVACGSGRGGDIPVDDTTPGPSTSAPAPGTIPDDAGPVFVETTEILLMESFPVQAALRVMGHLPTPCHQAVWQVEVDGSTIEVVLASVADPDTICTQVLEPFELSVPLGAFETGSWVVTLNGEEIGEFEV